MTEDQVREILDRVLNWPPEDQEKFSRFIGELEQWRAGEDAADLGSAQI